MYFYMVCLTCGSCLAIHGSHVHRIRTQPQLAPAILLRESWREAGKVIGKFKMAKHFTWCIDDDGVFTYRRDDAAIAAEARLDGLYVIRTSLPQSALDGPGTVRAYKRLSTVERSFRSLKSVDLKVRPVYHRTEPRVRAHVFLCMLAVAAQKSC